MNLNEFNSLDSQSAYNHMMKCCTSTNWCASMVNARPFKNSEELYTTADEIWSQCSEKDFLEAFEGHPKIGDVTSLREKYKNTLDDASHEQSGVNSATEEILQELSLCNEQYFKRYGFIFIVCATGKSAMEMLVILKSRLNNDREKEINIAANEQAKITQIRLEKLL